MIVSLKYSIKYLLNFKILIKPPIKMFYCLKSINQLLIEVDI